MVSIGLDPDELGDRRVFWAFRNAVHRVEDGGSWVPAIAVRLLRKSYTVCFVPEGAGVNVGPFVIEAAPDRLFLRSVERPPTGVLVAHIDWPRFVAHLATTPNARDWRMWIRGGGVRFVSEPLWLKLLLKLV